MRVIIAEAFSNETIGSFQTELGMRVRQGHYDLVKSSTNEFILPGLWNATIKPGDSIIMTIREYRVMTSCPSPLGKSPRHGAFQACQI